ncbi:related to nuclear envelope protein Cut11p [Cephalotrichum gorgonifer]|uniref:Related to nuclear envelope protein Cut11p n=1 Tax=Cephalotrichum gorgonifer TaxID=2041049 RepID=A0AAE8N2U4_9PEZI|nr:related to nuclear envelope protein Cut11p [Cephalotrichum gorgonifer]
MANSKGKRKAPYKDFLSPALHGRFASTAALLVVVAYLEALVLADWSSWFWSWFPFGPILPRTLFLFGGGMIILVLRVAQYHVGIRTSNSLFHTIAQSLMRTQTYWTFLWYAASSVTLYIPLLSSYSADTEMHWIVYRNGDRARLNEKPLFLATYLLTCAVMQAAEHIIADEDRLVLGDSVEKANVNSTKGQESAPASPLGQVIGRLPGIMTQSSIRAASALCLHLPLYYLAWRPVSWGWTLFFLRPFYNLPKTNMLPPSGPATFYTLKNCLVCGFLVFIFWRVLNVAFSIFMARKPLKNGKPLTAESKDPNGSLLNGLKSKKQYIRGFAMWELAFISREFEDRRIAIFQDIDREEGPVWSQIYTICLDLVKTLGTRVDEFGKQPAPPPAEPAKIEQKSRTSAPPKEDPIFQRQQANKSMRAEVERVVDRVARSPGETPISNLSPVAKKTWKMAKDTVLTPGQQDALQPQNMLGQLQQLLVKFLRNDLGAPFRQEYRNRIAAAVLGTPSAELGLYLNAIESLGMMAVRSLGEDKFGNVHRDVPAIIRTFTSTVRKLEAFKANFPVHWSDVGGSKEAPEVDALVGALKGALRKLVFEFEPYRNDLRLTLTDIRLAKEAAGGEDGDGRGPEMEMAEKKR